MQSKITLIRLLFVASIVANLFFIKILFLPNSLNGKGSHVNSTLPANSQTLQNQVDSKPVTFIVVAQQASLALPTRLKIPKINVDATIESVGLTLNGEMDVPKGPENVAWFNLGQRPGNNGNAVIAGHSGVWKNGKATVFYSLHKLSKGDKLYVEDEKGTITTFVMQESRKYDANADASGIFGSSDGKAHLNLITCESWNKVLKIYSKRLVVFTDKE